MGKGQKVKVGGRWDWGPPSEPLISKIGDIQAGEELSVP